MNSLKARVAVRGLQAIDRRTLAVRGLFQWRSDLVVDLGSEDTLSAQQKAIIEIVVWTRLFLDHVDSYLLALPSPVNHRERSVLPIVLGQLGLERKARDLTPTLAEIRQQYVKPTHGEGQNDGR